MADSHAVFGSAPNCYRHICLQCTFPKDDHAEAQRAPRHSPNPPRAARRFGAGEWRARYADIAQRAAERGQPHGSDPFAVKHHRSPEQQSLCDCARRRAALDRATPFDFSPMLRIDGSGLRLCLLVIVQHSPSVPSQHG